MHPEWALLHSEGDHLVPFAPPAPRARPALETPCGQVETWLLCVVLSVCCCAVFAVALQWRGYRFFLGQLLLLSV